ncbi:TSUP family transporter [Kaistella sp. DKR-2]|uniref:TSUP family transporter n=1 Tax=Kaistella soli TaxID=2849654 RepID=UPI001C27BE53|nr:TSUP family transporter [Kaistella soli]MBU8881737.1 TSUP family transporter [Kaistella soli]
MPPESKIHNKSLSVFLNLENLKVLIVGGGTEALESLQLLIESFPKTEISLIFETVSEEIKNFSEKQENIRVHERRFFEDDFYNAHIAIITDCGVSFYTEIIDIVQKKNVLISIANKPELSDFQLESFISKTNGPLQDDQKLKWQYSKEAKKYRRLVIYLSLGFAAFFLGIAFDKYFSYAQAKDFVFEIPKEFYWMLAIGFFAQMVDGALGMGYGLTSSTLMLGMGVKLPSISGSIHTAEMFSSAMSGYSHYKYGNVNKKMLLYLAVPGIIGAVAGSLLLIYLGNEYEDLAKGLMATYTLLMGYRITRLAFRKTVIKKKTNMGRLGFLGGMMDAFGGGGWGPIVTSTLLSKGRKTNYVIGTVSMSEFFVTLAAAIVFFSSLGVSNIEIISGLIIGGVLAAPIAARLAGKMPRKTALIFVAALLIISSARNLYKIFF